MTRSAFGRAPRTMNSGTARLATGAPFLRLRHGFLRLSLPPIPIAPATACDLPRRRLRHERRQQAPCPRQLKLSAIGGRRNAQRPRRRATPATHRFFRRAFPNITWSRMAAIPLTADAAGAIFGDGSTAGMRQFADIARAASTVVRDRWRSHRRVHNPCDNDVIGDVRVDAAR